LSEKKSSPARLPAIILPEEYPQRPVAELLAAAEEGLVGFDQRLIRVLLGDPAGVARYANEHPETELTAEFIDLFCQAPTPDAAPFLCGLASEFRDDLPEELIEALARVGAPALEPLLEAYEENRDDPGEIPTALAFLKVKDPRVEAVFDAQSPEDAEFLREVASGPSVSEPFDIHELYPEAASPYVGDLPLETRKEFLRSPDQGHRIAALSSFLDSEVPPGVLPDLLRAAREDPDAEVRGVAWETLDPAASEDEALLTEMIGRLNDGSVEPQERAGLAVALAAKPKVPGFGQAVETLYAGRATRARALQAMWRSLDRRFATYASQSLDDKDPEILEQAVLAAGYLGSYADAPRLEQLFEDEDQRENALFAYALCTPADVSRAHVRKLFRQIEELADGLSTEEAAVVAQALDLRLEMHGLQPVFNVEVEEEESLAPAAAKESKPGRNDPCPCGSGKKYKNCCGK
jgi:hypothetical protein